MEIKELISQAGGKAFALSGSIFDERIITELFSRFVPERQYVENGGTILRSPWSAVSEVFRNLKAVEEQNFSAAKNQTSFNKMHFEAWFDKAVFNDADLDAFLSHLSDYKIIENYIRKDDAQKVTVSFIYVDTLLIRLINQFSQKTTPANDFAHCQLRFEPLMNEFDSKASAKITVFRKSFENVAYATEEEDPQFVKDKLEILRLLASEEYGLLGDFKENGLFVSFVVKDYESIQLLRIQGRLYELFLYHALKKCNLFDDVQTSLYLIWDASAHDKDTILKKNLHADNQIGYQNYKNKKKELEKDFENKVYNTIGKKNEIDIVMSRGMNLYFASCKMTHKLATKFRTEINEVARRFNATPILAVTKDMSLNDQAIQYYLEAARTEGVSVIGLETVLDDGQLCRVIEKLQEGYLVQGKQYCEKDTDHSATDTVSVNRSSAYEDEIEHSHADNPEAYEKLLRKLIESTAVLRNEILAHLTTGEKEKRSEEKELGLADRYEGETANGIPNGVGVYYLANGDRYEGTFKEGRPFGASTYYFNSKTNPAIQRIDGKFDGFEFPPAGRVFYSNGAIYGGEIKNGLPHGIGLMFYKDGAVYRGRFDCGKCSGPGALNMTNGSIFVGGFNNDTIKKGIYYDKQFDSFYYGAFENRLRSGLGKYFYKDGSISEGTYVNGKLNGLVLRTGSDNTAHEEYYIAGQKADSNVFETVDLDDPAFLFLKVENDLERIIAKNCSISTKKAIINICSCLRQMTKNNDGIRFLKRRIERIRDGLLCCADAYAVEAVRSGDNSLFEVKNAIISVLKQVDSCKECIVLQEWTPKRQCLDKATFLTYPTFNSSRSNDCSLVDERAFVEIKKHGETAFNTDLYELFPGEQYDVRIWFHNNANSNLDDVFGCAKDVRITSSFPSTIKKCEQGRIAGSISSSNSDPKTVYAERIISTTCNQLILQYVPGSALIHNHDVATDINLSEELFTKGGTLIGLGKPDGIIPADASGYIEYTIKAEQASCTIIQEVSFDGEHYQEKIDAMLNSEVYYRLTIANSGNVGVSRAYVRCIISDGFNLTPGSVTLYANSSKKGGTLSDSIISHGFNLGRIGYGNTIYITFKGTISKEASKYNYVISMAGLSYDFITNDHNHVVSTTRIRVKNSSLTPWGPARKTFTWKNPAPHATFNSITDNPSVGDERNFVRIREANATNKFTDEVHLTPGKIYEIYIYYMNDASPALENTSVGTAHDVRVRSSFPHIVTPARKFVVNATISASDTVPRDVWDGAYLTTDDDVVLEYVPNSLILHSYTETHGRALDANELFSRSGTLIPIDNDLPGVITSKSGKECGHITYCLVVKKADALISIPAALNKDASSLHSGLPYYHHGNDIDCAIFNSVVDHPVFGDEREFVHIRRWGTEQWLRTATLQEGHQYEVEIFWRNDALPKYNDKAAQNRGVAFQSKVAVDLPDNISGFGAINVVIAAENIKTTATDQIELRVLGSKEVRIQYIAGSAKIYNQWKTNGSIVASSLFSFPKGMYIGLNALNGVIPGGDDYCGQIRFVFEVRN